MEIAKEIQRSSMPAWVKTIASLLPLWFFSVAISVEGFPRPPVSIEVAFAAFGAFILANIVLLWKSWVTIEFVLYSLIPYLLMVTFDEISTSYKTPFIFTCALILTVGAIPSQIKGLSRLQKWLFLLVVGILTLALTRNATEHFWQMASELGYEMCFPDYHGCAPLTGTETPWWVLFFSI
jgi:hypothetical protein